MTDPLTQLTAERDALRAELDFVRHKLEIRKSALLPAEWAHARLLEVFGITPKPGGPTDEWGIVIHAAQRAMEHWGAEKELESARAEAARLRECVVEAHDEMERQHQFSVYTTHLSTDHPRLKLLRLGIEKSRAALSTPSTEWLSSRLEEARAQGKADHEREFREAWDAEHPSTDDEKQLEADEAHEQAEHDARIRAEALESAARWTETLGSEAARACAANIRALITHPAPAKEEP